MIAIDILNSHPNSDVSYSDIKNVEELKNFFDKNSDVYVLMISAHGFHDEQQNVVGLYIGNELLFATDQDVVVPPVVILSACHVAPRGLVAVTVTHMLHRIGV